MLWQLLILTQPSRQELLLRLMNRLSSQIVNGDIAWMIRTFDPGLSLGANRELMRQDSPARYINFLDDDDMVPEDYVYNILPLLDGTDYIGHKVQGYQDGVIQKMTYHSLRYKGWWDDADGYYRDISHINPIRRELALECVMDGGVGEDSRWADTMRALGHIRTEHYIDRVLYYYYYGTNKGGN